MDTITINKKIIPGIMAIVAISVVLLSKRNPAGLILFYSGVGAGLFIGLKFKEE